jgi:putative FmdB family regulatory protein
MPIYAYRCATCGHAKDLLRKISDPVLSTCPACGAETFNKQVTAAGFQLKGSGWYVTDFREGAKTVAKGDSAAKDEAKTNGASADAAKADSGKAEAGKTDAPATPAAASPAPASAPASPATPAAPK